MSLVPYARRALTAMASAALFVSCTASDRTTGSDAGLLSVAVQPQMQARVNSSAASAIINRSRLTVVGVTDIGTVTSDTVGGPFVIDVDPSASQWLLPIEFGLPDNYASISIFVELINVLNGVETVEWSGASGPIRISTARKATQAASVKVFEGGIENAFVTSVSIQQADASLLEGSDLHLTALTETTGPAGTAPSVSWSSTDTSVATVTQNGVVLARRDGIVHIYAAVGPARDTIRIEARSRPASIRLTPDTIRDISVGEEVVVNAEVRDARGKLLYTEVVTWSSAAEVTLAALGNGRFVGRAVGTTTLRASIIGFPALSATTAATITSRIAANIRVSWVGSNPADTTSVGSHIIFLLIGGNTGSVTTPAAHARVRLVDANTGAVAFDSVFDQPSIPAATPLTYSILLHLAPARAWPDFARISVTADAHNAIVETDETDNTAVSTILHIRRPTPSGVMGPAVKLIDTPIRPR